MPVVIDKKVQLEILDEVNEKAVGKHLVKIDRTDPVREFNLQELYRNDCFVVITAEGNRHEVLGILSPSEQGHKYRSELAAELEKIEHMRRQTEAFEETNRKAEKANRIAQEALIESKKANKLARWANGWAWVAIIVTVLLFILRALGYAP